MSTYAIDGRRLSADDSAFTLALASAYAGLRRPRCLCCPNEPEMYVVRLGPRFRVKRMPGTGVLHDPQCPSYELPQDMSGLARALQTAIREQPDGTTRLKLEFPLSKRLVGSSPPPGEPAAGSVARSMPGLTLRALLHYLWDEAGLTRWQPGFAGRRSWATVHKRLLAAIEGKQVCGRPLEDVLYVPEPFYAEHSADVNARRTARWTRAMRGASSRNPRMLLLGEVKEFIPTRFGQVAVIKQLPDQPFVLGDDLYRRLAHRFEPALGLWGTTPSMHLVILATFTLGSAGLPTIEALLLMPTNGQWLPVDDAWDVQLLHRLQHEGRTFARCLRYDVPEPAYMPSVVLLDTTDTPCPLTIVRDRADSGSGPEHKRPGWTWRATEAEIPALPSPSNQTSTCEDMEAGPVRWVAQ